jgi:hypothetical protein|tara:strand:- start:1003 stop:1539 length:537 start_codon:yes stop_codon:yes gene_type:complete
MATVDYKIIKNFFSKEELKVYQPYCDKQLSYNINNFVIDRLSFSPSCQKDLLMDAVLEAKLPIVEKVSGLKLYPTYTYWRYYVFGATLTKHTDRPACEVSITACIKKYDNWPIVIEGDSFEINEGDAVIYDGCNQTHWRPGVYKGEGMAQVFFHYVDQLGPNTKHAYDSYCIEIDKTK